MSREIEARFLYHEDVGRARIVAVLAAMATLSWAGSALAADPGLIDQYVEDIPTAGGTHHSGGSAGPTGSGGTTAGGTGAGTGATGGSTSSPSTSATLPSTVKTDLYKHSGKDAKTLEQIATSPRYGAPPTHNSASVPEPESPGTLGAAASALGGDGTGVLGLLIGLAAIAAAAVAAATIRRRHA